MVRRRASAKRIFGMRCSTSQFHDASAAREEAALRGIALAPTYLVVVLEAERSDDARPVPELGELHALAADAFRAGDAELGFAERGSALVVFVPAVRGDRREQRQNGSEFAAENAWRGASRICASPAAWAPSKRSRTSRRVSRRRKPRWRSGGDSTEAVALRVYDELGAYPLLYEGADVERLRGLRRKRSRAAAHLRRKARDRARAHAETLL